MDGNIVDSYIGNLSISGKGDCGPNTQSLPLSSIYLYYSYLLLSIVTYVYCLFRAMVTGNYGWIVPNHPDMGLAYSGKYYTNKQNQQGTVSQDKLLMSHYIGCYF